VSGRIRILNLIAQFPGQTGSGTYLNAILNEGLKKNYEMGLIGAIQNDQEFLRDDLSYLNLIQFDTGVIPFNIVGMSDNMPYNSTRYTDLTDEMYNIWRMNFKEAVLKAMEIFKPDIILTHHLWLLSSMIVELKLNIPVYAFCHGTDIRQFLSVDRFQNYVKDNLKQLDGIFSLNNDQKNLIEELFNIEKHKIHVVGGGYNEDVFYPLENKEIHEVTKIVYAGKLSYAKGLKPLIKAFKELKEEHHITLSIAGSGNGAEEEEIRKLGNIEDIKFLGNLPQEVLADLFRESDIFVLPSYYEGLPLVVMEALATHLRIVVSNFSGLIDYIGDSLNNSGLIQYVQLPTSLILNDLDEKEELKYKENLKKALENQIINHKVGYNNFAPFKSDILKFSWEGVFNSIEKIILF